jgi:uncharacterized protein YndB with AHSA1/START domain
MEPITIETTVHAPLQKVWMVWNDPAHIMNWCHASDDWYAPTAENDLREGGKFRTTMAARDGSVQFDFGGVYTAVVPYERIAYTMGDKRNVEVTFTEKGENVTVTETFDPERQNPIEMQRTGWQAILNNFKAYTELLKE